MSKDHSSMLDQPSDDRVLQGYFGSQAMLESELHTPQLVLDHLDGPFGPAI